MGSGCRQALYEIDFAGSGGVLDRRLFTHLEARYSFEDGKLSHDEAVKRGFIEEDEAEAQPSA